MLATLCQNPEFLVGHATKSLQPLLQSGLASIAEPVVSQSVTLCGIHGSDKLECVERLSTGVHLLKDQTYGFVRGVVSERNNRDLVALEVLQHFILELLKQLALRVVAFSNPIIAKSILPRVPVEGMVQVGT